MVVDRGQHGCWMPVIYPGKVRLSHMFLCFIKNFQPAFHFHTSSATVNELSCEIPELFLNFCTLIVLLYLNTFWTCSPVAASWGIHRVVVSHGRHVSKGSQIVGQIISNLSLARKKNIEFGWPFGSYEANWGVFKTRSQAVFSRGVLEPHFEYPDSLILPSPPIILWITKFASNPQVTAIPPSVHQQLSRPVGGHNLLGVAWRPQVPVTLQQNCFLLSTVCNVTSFHLFLNSLLLS